MPSQATRIAVTVAALVIAVASVVWFAASRSTPREGAVAGLDDELGALFDARAEQGEPLPASDDWPPPLTRGPIPEDVVRKLFPNLDNGRLEYHPTLFQRRIPGLDTWEFLSEIEGGRYRMRTNSLGFRGDEDPSPTQPDLRVIVTGASNAEGKCDDRQAAPALLEQALAARSPGLDVEVLNAGCAGYTFYNTLAQLELYADLQPDVFCLVAYGGNDFFGCVKFDRWYEHRRRSKSEPWSYAALEASDDPFLRKLVGTEIGQAVYYLNNPEGVQHTIDAACGATREMAALCRERAIRFVCLYLPPPLVAQPRILA